jgi:hypothetical protein
MADKRSATAKARNKGQRGRMMRSAHASARGLLRGVDSSRLSERGKSELARARREDRPVQANAVPKPGDAAKAVSPWVRRALEGKLNPKNLTGSTGPRGDVLRGTAKDVARGEPAIVQAAASQMTLATKRATNALNRQRVAAGQRPIDFPGRPSDNGMAAKKMQRRKANKGPFVPSVRLNPARIPSLPSNASARAKTAVATAPRREGASSSTSRGPGPITFDLRKRRKVGLRAI